MITAPSCGRAGKSGFSEGSPELPTSGTCCKSSDNEYELYERFQEPIVSGRPIPGAGRAEMAATNRSFAVCDKLTSPAVAQGEREMSWNIAVESHDDVFVRVASS
jgi:hypothetical protein